MLKIRLLSLGLLCFSMSSFGQDLLNLLEETETVEEQPVTATFKSTRLVNGHTIETRTNGILEFVISHRFGRLNTGIDELFGLDNAAIRFGLEYGITDRLNVGLGRSSFLKVYDGFVKYKFLSQSNFFPFTLTGLVSAVSETADFPEDGANYEPKHRYSYTYQALIARKFNSDLSIQLMPTLIHRNLVPTEEDANDLFSLGLGGRYKLNPRLAINAEYYLQVSEVSDTFQNAIALGFDIETGGHVFQLHVTNAQQMNEPGFIGETDGDFFDGDIHFGFNISRVFNIAHKD